MKAQKVVAGHEVEKTNEFLQSISSAHSQGVCVLCVFAICLRGFV